MSDPSTSRFQQEIEALAPGETLELRQGEFAGPIVIRAPLTVEGKGATIWALNGPVVSVQSPGVTLRNLQIEVTGEGHGHDTIRNCALLVESGLTVQLDHIEVRGLVDGLAEEEGAWRYPHVLSLGQIPHGTPLELLARVVVPVPCRVRSNIAGLSIQPPSLAAGAHEIRIGVDKLREDTLLMGSLFLSTAFLTRRIAVSGFAPSTKPSTPASGSRLLWEPSDWVAHVRRPKSAAPAPAPAPQPVPAPPVIAPPPPAPVGSPPGAATPRPAPQKPAQPVATTGAAGQKAALPHTGGAPQPASAPKPTPAAARPTLQPVPAAPVIAPPPPVKPVKPAPPAPPVQPPAPLPAPVPSSPPLTPLPTRVRQPQVLSSLFQPPSPQVVVRPAGDTELGESSAPSVSKIFTSPGLPVPTTRFPAPAAPAAPAPPPSQTGGRPTSLRASPVSALFLKPFVGSDTGGTPATPVTLDDPTQPATTAQADQKKK